MEFPHFFLGDLPEGLPPKRPFDHRIELEPRTQPTAQWQFRLTHQELEELRMQLDYLLEKKKIRPSSSPFAAPILFTSKKDGGYGMCTDYKTLNRVTIKSLQSWQPLVSHQQHRHWSSAITGFRRRAATNRVRVTKFIPTGAKLSDTRQGDARDRACLQAVVVPSDRGGRDSTSRPSRPTVHSRTATPQPTTYSAYLPTVEAIWTAAWQQVTMDVVTRIPAKDDCNNAIFVVVDKLTKMAHFVACKKSILTKETTHLFIVRLHGIPPAIISDRNTKFTSNTSNFWRNLWEQFGTRLQFSSAYHPKTDGQTKRTNQTMEKLIRATCDDVPD
ncbi:hypothetical protein CLOM_g21658 [Closterium sp. NIES-68]|nr:hypothetical protein CLOM_g21658 [Closterium sp. NIES-68]